MTLDISQVLLIDHQMACLDIRDATRISNPLPFKQKVDHRPDAGRQNLVQPETLRQAIGVTKEPHSLGLLGWCAKPFAMCGVGQGRKPIQRVSQVPGPWPCVRKVKVKNTDKIAVNKHTIVRRKVAVTDDLYWLSHRCPPACQPLTSLLDGRIVNGAQESTRLLKDCRTTLQPN